ncbi:serine/threonine protein kinase, CMGC [Saitoella coloradoensis]
MASERVKAAAIAKAKALGATKKRRKGQDLQPIVTNNGGTTYAIDPFGSTEPSPYPVISPLDHTKATSYHTHSHSNQHHNRAPEYSSDEDEGVSGDEEDLEDYKKGGYHPVQIGETYRNGRYTVVRKLGWGHFSTVWLCHDKTYDRHVALKVVRSAEHYTETAIDEIKLLNRIVESNPSHPGRAHVVSLLDNFEHRGPNGTHICMVFEVLGENLLGLIKRYNHRGVPTHLVKQITKQVLLGLDYLHRECGVIHTDLKPENVLIAIEDVERVTRMIMSESEKEKGRLGRGAPPGADGRRQRPKRVITGSRPLPSPALSTPPSGFPGSGFTSATSDLEESRSNSQIAAERKRQASDVGSLNVPEHYVREQTADALEREVSEISLDRNSGSNDIVRSPTSTSADPEFITVKIADLGNACWTHHHFTNDIQTRQYRSPEVILGSKWGASTDMWSMACMTFELETGDYLFDPQEGSKYRKDDDHVAQIIELLGRMPRHIALAGKYSKEIFNSKGELRKIHKLKHWELSNVLGDKYHFTKEQAEEFASFLLPMLEINPERRADAGGMSNHPWLRDAKAMEGKNVDVPLGSCGQNIPGWTGEFKSSSRR